MHAYGHGWAGELKNLRHPLSLSLALSLSLSHTHTHIVLHDGFLPGLYFVTPKAYFGTAISLDNILMRNYGIDEDDGDDEGEGEGEGDIGVGSKGDDEDGAEDEAEDEGESEAEGEGESEAEDEGESEDESVHFSGVQSGLGLRAIAVFPTLSRIRSVFTHSLTHSLTHAAAVH